MNNKPAQSRQNIFPLRISDSQSLASIYMPYIKNGGLFVPSTVDIELGDQVLLLISLFDKTTSLAISGTVVWINPAHTRENKTQGFGVSFNNNDFRGRDKLERALPVEKSPPIRLAM